MGRRMWRAPSSANMSTLCRAARSPDASRSRCRDSAQQIMSMLHPILVFESVSVDPQESLAQGTFSKRAVGTQPMR